jgi:hypothetical protein
MVKDLSQFKERWTLKSELIKNQSFSKQQCFHLANSFINECENIHKYGKEKEVLVPYFEESRNDLNLALNIAYSNYRNNEMVFWLKWWEYLFQGVGNINFLRIK